MRLLVYCVLLLHFGKNYAFTIKTDNYDSNGYNEIEYPCHVSNLNCIRKFFARNWGCKPVYKPAPDPCNGFEVPTMDLPSSNATINLIGLAISGLNSGKIEQFYINKKTDTLVLEVVFEELTIYTPKAVFSYYRKGREAIKVWDHGRVTAKNFSLTLTSQHWFRRRKAISHIFAYLSEVPTHLFGPGVLNPQNKDLTREDMKWLDDFGSASKEALVSSGITYLNAFMQTKICKL